MDLNGSVSLESKLDGCVVGEPKTITLTVIPTKNDQSGFSADVQSLDDYDDEDDATGDEESHPPKSKGKSGEHLVISIGLGKPRKSKDY